MAKKNLKNYTSESPVSKSVGRIEKELVEAGAENISKIYKDKKLEAIFFQMEVPKQGITSFKLPAKIEKCYEVFKSKIKRPRPGTEERLWEQAQRTAWKLQSDWVEVQLSMFMLDQVEFMEVFMQYMVIGKETLYEKLKKNDFKLLPGAK